MANKPMNGAEALVHALVDGGVEVCFTNPGTSEMHFVAALDKIDGIRSVLCLFEGVATGAADGYGRMADKPACTLLHLGPGLGNGIANLHNARRAQTPIVNIIGEHATFHRAYDAPLTSDIEGMARTVSGWVRTSIDSSLIAKDCADAIEAAMQPPGQIATLISPADVQWNSAAKANVTPYKRSWKKPRNPEVDAIARVLQSSEPTLILLGGQALRDKTLQVAARIAAKSGAKLMTPMSNARLERGRGRPALDRVPYVVAQALKALENFQNIVLVSAKQPVAFFGYPEAPSVFTRPGCRVWTLARDNEDPHLALENLAELIGAKAVPPAPAGKKPELPTGSAITLDNIGMMLGALLPEGAIVCDESATSGRGFFPHTYHAEPHDWLQNTGGAIGMGMPVAVGAAVACPDRKVINLQADGSGMYTPQALWTQARENLNVLTVIWSNRAYAILKHELTQVGASNPGRKATEMLSLDNPDLDWVSLARGMGVDGRRVSSMDELIAAFQAGLALRGPYLIEVPL